MPHHPQRQIAVGVFWTLQACCLACGVTLATTTYGDDSQTTPRRPNFVLILADDLGYGDLSCYGNTEVPTPHIDRLASQGMRFTDFHSSGTVCSPTRAGLLTGRYQQRSGVDGVIYADPKQNRHHGLQTAEITFAELLKTRGYATSIVGKWHLGYESQYNPVHQGFDLFRGYVSGNIDYISHCDRMGIADWWHNDRLEPETGYSTHLITSHAVSFIEKHRDRPFCLYVAHEAVHTPFQGPTDKPVRAVGQGNIKGAERTDRRAAYREMTVELDKGVGEILTTVERLGLAENTLIIFLSDNGATPVGSNGILHGHKGSVWEGGHRVPAIAWWPPRISAGTTCDVPVISLDIFPTLIELAGLQMPTDRIIDGTSLVPIFEKPNTKRDRPLYWNYRNRGAVRHGRWKLVVNQAGRDSVGLFDLSVDLAESRNLARTHPDRVMRLQSRYVDWLQRVRTGATRQPNIKR